MQGLADGYFILPATIGDYLARAGSDTVGVDGAAFQESKQQAEERLLLGAEYQDGGFVFATTFGSPLDPANMYRTFKGLLQAAELDDFRVYDLRHTCATLLLLAGENPKVVSERLGHASVTLTLDTYSHVLPAMQEESARKLEAMFGSG